MSFTPPSDYHKAYEAFKPKPLVWPHEYMRPAKLRDAMKRLAQIEERLERIEAMLARLVKNG